MDVSKIGLKTSWKASKDLAHVLCISSSSGAILDQPPSYDDDSDEGSAPTVILSQTLSSEACQIHIDASEGLAGYLLTGVEVLSGARTVEVYDSAAGGEYIGTSRGALAEKRSDGTKLFSCELELPSETLHTRLTLKLLSLKGSVEVALKRLQLTLKEDHSGISQQTVPPFPCSDATQLDSKHFLDSLAGQNLPPGLQSLVASLQHLQTASPNQRPKCATTSATATAVLPPNLSAMASALRQMRPAPPLPPPDPTPHEEPDHVQLPGEAPDHSLSSGGLETSGSLGDLSERERLILRRLEEKLVSYIDEKFTELQTQMNKKFEEWTQKIQQQSFSRNIENTTEPEKNISENGHQSD